MGRWLGAAVVLLLAAPPAWACAACRVEVRARTFAPGFAETAALLLLPLLVIAVAAALVHHADRSRHADPRR